MSPRLAIYACLLAILVVLSCNPTPRPISLFLDSTFQSSQIFREPCDLEILPHNKLLVSDSSRRCVFVLNEHGEALTRIEHSSLRHPTALVALSAQEFFVADISGNSLLRFNLAGNLLSRFGDEGRAQGLMSRPIGLALAPDSTLWMTEQGNHRVQSIGAKGRIFYGTNASDSLQAPCGITTARDGAIYFTDSATARVWQVSADMTKIASWGEAEGLQNPTGIALDQFENVYIAESRSKRIRIYSPTSKPLSVMLLQSAPTALAFDDKNRLYVLSMDPPRVQRFIAR